MITLFTGAPGAGKTAALVDFLSKLPGDRPIYSDGLEGLKLPHTPCDANNWHTELPDGAILVVDEAQRKWRPAGSGAKVTDDIAAMETHRHRGIDIFLTTQAPALINSNVRNLVGRHVHIRDVGIMGRWWYEWPETNTAMAWKTCVNRRKYKLPKKAFDLYTSSSLHIAPVRGIPPKLYLAIGAFVALLVLGFMVYQRIQKTQAPQLPAPSQSHSSNTSGAPMPTAAASPRAFDPERGPIDDRVAWIPRISNRPESAPAFDHLRVVVNMPKVVGGWCQGETCRCINQQGTDSGLSDRDCAAWLKNPPFDPYTRPSVDKAQDSRDTPTQPTQNAPAPA